MPTVKDIIAVMNMRHALGITEDGSCFGVSDPSRLRDTLSNTLDKRRRQYLGSIEYWRCENPFCQKELNEDEVRLDHIVFGLRVCGECFHIALKESIKQNPVAEAWRKAHEGI